MLVLREVRPLRGRAGLLLPGWLRLVLGLLSLLQGLLGLHKQAGLVVGVWREPLVGWQLAGVQWHALQTPSTARVTARHQGWQGSGPGVPLFLNCKAICKTPPGPHLWSKTLAHSPVPESSAPAASGTLLR